MTIESKPKEADEVGHEVEAEHRGEMYVQWRVTKEPVFLLFGPHISSRTMSSALIGISFYDYRMSMMKQMKVRYISASLCLFRPTFQVPVCSNGAEFGETLNFYDIMVFISYPMDFCIWHTAQLAYSRFHIMTWVNYHQFGLKFLRHTLPLS